MKRLLALTLALLPSPALAQAYQCSVPGALPPAAPVAADGPRRAMAPAGYTLAASWSPQYCKTSHDIGAMQCARASGRFGFVLHGLWPEAARGPSPQWCSTSQPLSPALLRRHLCMTPSPGLMAHEWAKHGTCMARTPDVYFQTAARLWSAIQWPDVDRLSRKRDLTAGDLRDEFAAANRGWPRESVGIELGRSGWLREIHLCYDRDLRPSTCPASRRGPSDSAPMKIWRGL